MKRYDIGTIHQTKRSGDLEIVEVVDSTHRRIRFTKTGYETIASLSDIKSGKVKDNLLPSVGGIGYLGYCQKFDDHPMRDMIYSCWTAKIYKSKRLGYSLKPETLCFADFMEKELKSPYWEKQRIRKLAESILLEGLWEGYSKTERERLDDWWSDLQHMIDTLSNPNK